MGCATAGIWSAALAGALGRASALLFTPMWDEPFGLAAIEAMACGLPVAAFDNGAAREVIGRCGAFARPGDAERLAAALRRALAMDRRAACMIAAYEACYAEVIAHRRAALPRVRATRPWSWHPVRGGLGACMPPALHCARPAP